MLGLRPPRWASAEPPPLVPKPSRGSPPPPPCLSFPSHNSSIHPLGIPRASCTRDFSLIVRTVKALSRLCCNQLPARGRRACRRGAWEPARLKEPRWWSLRGTLAPSVPCHPPPHRQLPPPFRSQTVEPRLCWKMDAVHPSRAEPPAPPEPQERPTRRVVDRLSPELRMEKYILLSMDGKLLGPELSRIRSEMALPLERPDADLPQDLPAGYLCRQRRSLPTFPLPPGPQTPAELRGSSDVLCAGRFPAGLSRLVTGMQTPVSPRRRGSPPAPGTSRGGAGR